ncbi:hypothetical protein ACLOJK_018569 [Asimina triloba]
MGSHVEISMILAVIVCWGSMIAAVPNTNVTSILCNVGEYTRGDPFAVSLAYVLSDLVEQTPSSKGHDYSNISPFPNAFAYGHASCGGTISDGDCATCLSIASKNMTDACGSRIGGRAILYDCSIRYEQYPISS